MDENVLAQVQRIGADELAAVVRQDQQDPTFAISDWTVAQLSDQGIMNPFGLWLYRGTGRGASGIEREWQVVLKYITDLEEPEDPRTLWCQMRDAWMYESGLLRTLPGGMAAPNCYGIRKTEDACWIWLEYIAEREPRQWTTAEYAAAARALGRMNGAYLTGTPLPDLPWLCREHARYWTEAVDPGLDWDNPYVQTYISPSHRRRYERLVLERERIFSAMRRLPQVFSHFDYHRRNIKIRAGADGCDQVVALDWSSAGTGPAGSDLFTLVGMNAALFESDVRELPEREAVLLEAYEAGMRECGASINRETIRLGYQLHGGVFLGSGMPASISIWTRPGNEQRVKMFFGVENDALAAAWAQIGEFYIDHAEQALAQLDRLGM